MEVSDIAMPEVTSAEYVEGHKIRVSFNTGQRSYDMLKHREIRSITSTVPASRG